MSDNILYYEKQYLGRNKHSLIIRLILAAFCFAAWYYNEQNGESTDLLLIVGICILFFSSVLTFLVHFRTKVTNTDIELMQYWAIRKVKIQLDTIKEVEIVEYERFYVNNPVFNLHIKGRVHFYTTGDLVVKVVDNDGVSFLIGSQTPERLKRIIEEELGK